VEFDQGTPVHLRSLIIVSDLYPFYSHTFVTLFHLHFKDRRKRCSKTKKMVFGKTIPVFERYIRCLSKTCILLPKDLASFRLPRLDVLPKTLKDRDGPAVF